MSSSVKNGWNTMFITAVCVIFLKHALYWGVGLVLYLGFIGICGCEVCGFQAV